MTFLLITPNEIEILKNINNDIQYAIGWVTFFIGILITTVITRISMPEEYYKATILSSLFWVIIGACIIPSVVYAYRAYKKSGEVDSLMKSIKEEMIDEHIYNVNEKY